MTVRGAVVLGAYVAGAVVAGGLPGLLVGVAVVGVWALFRLEPRAFWGAAVTCMALAPFALMAQGLPGRPVVGPGFGTDHLAAHVLVGMSLALAGFAALLETVLRPRERKTGSWIRERLGGDGSPRQERPATAAPTDGREPEAPLPPEPVVDPLPFD